MAAQISRQRNEAARCAAELRMITSAEEFVRLRNSDREAEYSRAGTEEASLETWQAVIALYPEMREWVAYNKSVPLIILEQLARDPETRVRDAVAMRRKLSPALFEQLALDTSERVRLTILRNPKVPLSVLEKLTTDKDEYVRDLAVERLQRRQQE
jgi:hypothetical protein